MSILIRAALIALVACNTPSDAQPSSTPAPVAPLAPVVAVAPVLPATYVQLCVQCHGKDLKGYVADHAPSLVNPTFLESATDSFLWSSIAFGRPGTAMAAYGKQKNGPLDDAAITALVAFLRAQGPAVKPQLATTRGDAARGAISYAKNCFSCHGDGKTRGEAPMLANPEFQRVATDAFIRYAIEVGRPNTKMVAWKPLLPAGELDDLLAHIRQLGATAPAPEGQLPAPTGKEPLVINPNGKSPAFKLRADPCPKDQKCEDPRFVPADQVAAALAKKQRMIIIDARPQSEWMRVHITGAVSIPHHDLKRLDEMPKDGTWVIAYCACPHHLSGIVVDELRKRGYKNAVVLDEGILEWHRRAYPVVAGEGVVAPPKEQIQQAPLR